VSPVFYHTSQALFLSGSSSTCFFTAHFHDTQLFSAHGAMLVSVELAHFLEEEE